jgi:hypothetical protein
MIDSHMPEIMGEMVKAYYLGHGSSLKDLTNNVECQDPLQVGDHKHFYEYKIQELLLAVAFGMQPSKSWTGSYDTHGGYIILKRNGELACYQVYDRDKFKKFLYCNTKLETPRASRHEQKAVIFIHGCFWRNHSCKYGKIPERNPSFWKKKLQGNASRDLQNIADLQSMGWKVKII